MKGRLRNLNRFIPPTGKSVLSLPSPSRQTARSTISSKFNPLLRHPTIAIPRYYSTFPPPENGPAAAYESEVKSGILQDDENQRITVNLLQSLYNKLHVYNPPPLPPLPPPSKPSLLSRISRSRWFSTMADELHAPTTAQITLPPPPSNCPKGLYLYGSVGCGKSFLMDLFYANLEDRWKVKARRVHFHGFMMDVHQRGHRIKSNNTGEMDWIVVAAKELASESRVLCFDEFQVG